MSPEIEKRIAEGYCYLCATEGFAHKELCHRNPNRPAVLRQEQIQVGGVYRYKAAPGALIAPSEGVVKVSHFELITSGVVVYLFLWSTEAELWLMRDKPYMRGTFYDFDFFAVIENEFKNASELSNKT